MNLNVLTSNLYESIKQDDSKRVMEHWHASSIAKCPRTQYLMRKGVPPIQEPGAGKILRWKAGHIIEGVIRPYLKEQFPKMSSNVRIDSDTMDLSGEYDNYDPLSKTLIEIKSVSSHAVRYRKKDEDRHHLRDDKQYLHHEWQQHAYFLLLQEQGVKVENIVYLYITLDGLLVPYQTKVNPVLLEQVRQRLDYLNDSWRKQELPDCYCNDEDDPMFNCEYRWCDYKTGWDCCNVPVPVGVE